MMDSESDVQRLHPLKRLMLRFQQNYNTDFPASLLPLPAKKRKLSILNTLASSNSNPAATTVFCCLPAKKRVWALPPDYIPGIPNNSSTNSLPVKKRGWVTPSDLILSHTATNTSSLPAKKRVWTPSPDFFSDSTIAVIGSLPAKSKRRVWAPSLDVIPETHDSPTTFTTSSLTKKLVHVFPKEFIPSDSKTTITPSIPAQNRVLAPPLDLIHDTTTTTIAKCLPAQKNVSSKPPNAISETPELTTTIAKSLPAQKRVGCAPPLDLIYKNLTTNPATTKSSPSHKKVSAHQLDTIPETPQLTKTITTFLPAQKRVVCNPPPDFICGKSSRGFDLNLEYEPTAFQQSASTSHPCDIRIVGEEEKRELEREESVRDEGLKNSGFENDDNGIHADDEEDDGIECAVCGSTDGDPSDPIVFCDGCDLMVHTTCYGNPLIHDIPEGDWFCAKCSTSSNPSSSLKNPACCLCPITGGALKPTNDGKWAHLLCALYVPEVFFEDPDGREGINCSKVPQRRWDKGCYVCEGENGCVIDCSEPNCDLCFHVSCGLNMGLCIEYKEGRSRRSGGGIVAGFCKEHTELWKKQQESGKFKIVARY